MKPIDTPPLLSDDRVKRIKKIVGKFMYCKRGVDRKRLVALITMVSRIDPNEQDEKDINHFLDYMETHPDAVVRFHASDMILRANTYASYLTEPKARSFAAGYFLLECIPLKCAQEHLIFFPSSIAESETRCFFITGRDVIILRNTLEELVHPQPVTKI